MKQKKKHKNRQLYRQPPYPATFIKPRIKGICRWCGKPVNEKRRTYWHKACYEEFLSVRYPSKLKVWHRCKGKCAVCGKTKKESGRKLEYDHIVSLRDASRELKYWTTENLQLLCHNCHVKKTQYDNKARKENHNKEQKT